MNRKVSIITPSFNRAYIIHETAESIFRQTNPNWEWVIVDDGSTDESWEIINKYADEDSRVKVFKRQREPKGACTCRNIAVSKCTGDFIIFLDTDDLLASFCIEQRLEAFKSNPTMDFIIFPMLMFKQKPDDLKLLWNIDSKVDDIERFLIGDPVCQGTGAIWKKNSFVEIGMWDERLTLWQDIHLHLKSLLADLKYSKRMDLKPDVFIRISEISISRSGFHSPKNLESRYIVFQETALSLFCKNEIEKYQIGLKEMFVSIFINSLKTHSFYLSKQILSTAQKVNLLSKFELRRLYIFLYMFKFRMNKITRVNNFMLNTLGCFRFRGEVFLNKVIYNENIDR